MQMVACRWMASTISHIIRGASPTHQLSRIHRARPHRGCASVCDREKCVRLVTRELMRAAQAARLVNVITRGLSARSPTRMTKGPGDHGLVVVWSRRVSSRGAIYTACRVTNVLRYLDTGNRAGSIFVPIVAVRNEFANHLRDPPAAKKTTRGSIRGSGVVAMYSRGIHSQG